MAPAGATALGMTPPLTNNTPPLDHHAALPSFAWFSCIYSLAPLPLIPLRLGAQGWRLPCGSWASQQASASRRPGDPTCLSPLF